MKIAQCAFNIYPAIIATQRFAEFIEDRTSRLLAEHELYGRDRSKRCVIIIPLFKCQMYLAVFTTLKVDGDISQDRHTYTNTHVSEGLRFKVLVQEDAKV